ncbi:hypothetical protein RI129_013134 [Pyrocoelia pectoralis]|uniref:Bicaudal D-related protein homolog n=1 Tax=Pyrocoelia pectoralis TaxID=417401 RepID=A0AAN7V8M8_9COLE
MHTLEDYILEMENRSAIQHTSNTDDLWIQLQQKENDLVLAAELGNALLEKNEELKKQHEATVEEFCKKLEVRSLNLIRIRVSYIRTSNDISELTSKLSAKEGTIKQWERDKGNLVSELNSQNLRLTTQLKEAVTQECAVGKSNLHEHINSADSLRDELELVSVKKNELERRLLMAASERDSLATALEEASDRILLLERHAREQDVRYQQSLKEYSLPQERLSIEERISGEHRSLLAEMDVCEPTLSQECMSVYRQLRALCQQLKSHNDDDSGLHSDCSTSSFDDNQQFSAGLLNEVAQELVGLVLDTDVVRLLDRLEQARRDIQERDMELSRRGETVMELTSKASVCEVELRTALEERDRARHDASNSSMAQDEAVVKAREVRDQAVARRNKAEVELAKTRVELMQANSQLLEAIQQKVELSQQLEQWQMDMQELLDEQLKNKLSNHEIKMRNDVQIPSHVAPPRRRLLRFFQR